MKPNVHRFYIGTMAFILLAVTAYLGFRGKSYYSTSMEERFYHGDYNLLKPDGLLGHGLGVIGSLSMVLGVSLYMLRKRSRTMARLGKIRHWLEFHIFLCLLGPILILYHTSFKIGGIVAVSFWSMVAVALSGVIGRFIYIRIPRTIEGREMNRNEIRSMKKDLEPVLTAGIDLDKQSRAEIIEATEKKFKTRSGQRTIRKVLRQNRISRAERTRIMKIAKREISLNRRIDRLQTMQNLFRYWHVVHLPFALIMLLIMLIHVGTAIAFGYRWLF